MDPKVDAQIRPLSSRRPCKHSKQRIIATSTIPSQSIARACGSDFPLIACLRLQNGVLNC